ncbi:hypothetical protein [Haloarchaeobius sp. TZWWS8]|uniref:hypothetical protein n=1 Tax=Haloarchaeobius sp. TZWWS8 TaxID=3446121 RepID=UPI003EB9A4E8
MATNAAGGLAASTVERQRLQLAAGIILVGIGVFVAAMPSLAGGIVRFWLGIAFLAASAVMAGEARQKENLRDGLVALGETTGYLLVGFALLTVPFGQTRLATLLALLYAVTGIARFLSGFGDDVAEARNKRLSGIALVTLATLLVTGWPGNTAWVFGLLFGVGFAVVGVSKIAVALSPAREEPVAEGTFAEDQV